MVGAVFLKEFFNLTIEQAVEVKAKTGGDVMQNPSFTAADCTNQTIITGADGVMVPQVTEQQKRKRRATEAAKRAKQGRLSTARPGRPKSGSDGPYKEFKIFSLYDSDKSHCHVVGTSGDHEALGRLMRREARRVQLGQAKVKYAVSDGAEWIARQYRQQLPMLDEHILDYYHLREHVIETSQVLYGENTKKAESRSWRWPAFTTATCGGRSGNPKGPQGEAARIPGRTRPRVHGILAGCGRASGGKMDTAA